MLKYSMIDIKKIICPINLYRYSTHVRKLIKLDKNQGFLKINHLFFGHDTGTFNLLKGLCFLTLEFYFNFYYEYWSSSTYHHHHKNNIQSLNTSFQLRLLLPGYTCNMLQFIPITCKLFSILIVVVCGYCGTRHGLVSLPLPLYADVVKSLQLETSVGNVC